MGTPIKFPKTTVIITGSPAAPANTEQKVLFVGQPTASGSIIAGQIARNISNDKSEYGAIVGFDSMSFQMLRDARDLNQFVQFDYLAVADGAGASAAAGTVTIDETDQALNVASLVVLTLVATITTVEENFYEIGDTVNIANADTGTSNGAFVIVSVVDEFSFTVATTTGDETDSSTTITSTAPNGAVEAGSLTVYAGSQANLDFEVSIAEGDRKDAIGQALADLMNADSESPFTAANVDGVVTITTTNLGEIYNETPLYNESDFPSGLTVVLGAFTGGTIDPDLDSVLDAIGDVRYQTIVWPYNSDLDVVSEFLDARFNPVGEVLDGMAISGKADTFANLLTLGNSFNSQSLSVIGTENTGGQALNDIVEFPWTLAAYAGAIRSLRLQPGTSIAKFVITNDGSLDVFGGPALSSRPYANTPIPPLVESLDGQGFDKLEISQLNDAGISVWGNNKANNGVIMGQMVTTYKTDDAGNPDDTFKFMNFVDTASTGREYIANQLDADNAQTRLTSGNLIKNRSMTNSDSLSADIVGYYQDLTGFEFVVARQGEAELTFFKDNLSITIDLQTGVATIAFTLPIVTQLREINAAMQLAFNIEG